MENTTLKYRAFISYSHSDSRLAGQLHRWLESYRIPSRLVGRDSPSGKVPGRLHPIFRDREELPTSADLGAQIEAALQDSDTLIVICSPRAATSRWVNEEILSFKRLGRSGRILCLIVEGEPNATDKPGLEATECFAPVLRFHLAADGSLSTTPAEPIAADMRPGKDGRRDAWLKLVAGIAGVGFDELKQRELQRQLRRAVAISVASLLLLVTMAGLTFAAVLSRREAIRQRELAAIERDRAEDNFRDAREAVDRFYTKVSEDQLLKAEGLQPLRAELLKEALDYYKRFLSQRSDDPEFALESAIVQGNVGGILSEVGDPAEALAATQIATTALEKLHAEAPDDVRIITHLSGSCGNEAVNLHQLGRVEEALVAHDRALLLFELLPADTPEKTIIEWQRLLTTKGAFLAQLGRFEEAAQAYERGLEVGNGVAKEIAPLGVALEPSPQGLVVIAVKDRSPAAAAGIRAGDTIIQIADVETRVGEDMAAVSTRLRADVSLPVRARRGDDPIEFQVTPVYLGDFMTAVTKYNLGNLYLERLRQPEKAKAWLIAAVDEYQRTLLRESAASPDIRAGLAFAANTLGTCGYRLGDKVLQEKGTRDGVAAAEENVRLNPSVPRYRSSLVSSLSQLAVLLQGQGDLDGAITNCQKAVENLEVVLQAGGDLASDRLYLVQLLNNLGGIVCDRDGARASLPTYESALKAGAELQSATPAAPSLALALAQLQRNYGSALRKADRLQDAAEAYGFASKHYDDVLSAAEIQPAWLIQECASLECRRVALLIRLNQRTAAQPLKESFEARCLALGADPDGPTRVSKLRFGAIEALVETVMQLLPDNAEAAAEALHEAEEQLALELKSGSSAPGNAVDAGSAPYLDQIVRLARLRASVCSGDHAKAWQVFSDCLEPECAGALPLASQLDLVASLVTAGKVAEGDALATSVGTAITTNTSLRAGVQEHISNLRQYGFSEDTLERVIEKIGLQNVSRPEEVKQTD